MVAKVADNLKQTIQADYLLIATGGCRQVCKTHHSNNNINTLQYFHLESVFASTGLLLLAL